MGLSPVTNPAQADDATWSLHDAVTVEADKSWRPWQQNLRILRHHLTRPLPRPRWSRLLGHEGDQQIERIVYVLPSQTSGSDIGSAACLGNFVAFAAKTIENTPGLPPVRFVELPPTDYTKLAKLEQSLRDAVATALNDKVVPAKYDEISIDTTAGFKLFSIAGAAVTFASPAEFTYVTTSAPYEVQVFAVRAMVRPTRIPWWTS